MFGNAPLVIPLLAFGLIWLDRKVFYHAACLTLLSIPVNVALKISFQIPLLPGLGKVGFGFPSGHMQLVTSLYLALALQVKKTWFSGVILLLLIGFAWSLMYFGYHDFFQVLGGVFFALLLLIFYYLAYLKWPEKLAWIVLCFATCLIIYIHLRYPTPYVWEDYYGLWGLIIAEKITAKKQGENLLTHKLLATLLFVLGLVIIYAFFNYALGSNRPDYISQLQWFFVCFLPLRVNYYASELIKRLGFHSPKNSEDGD
ncbi:MAG: phosphatase PAP2 family protein [Tatlockia sp.]|nr:phosphatase PAP2 family protein [Tatlockia sp.]